MKPGWLKDLEWDKQEKKYNRCITCKHLGKSLHETKHKGKERVLVHECDIHNGCLNTKYSYACEDYAER